MAQVQAIIDAVNITLSIEETVRNPITIFPNPTNAILNIKGIDIKQAKLYDALGKKVLDIRDENTLDVSHLDAGVYLIEIITRNGKTTQRRIIKK